MGHSQIIARIGTAEVASRLDVPAAHVRVWKSRRIPRSMYAELISAFPSVTLAMLKAGEPGQSLSSIHDKAQIMVVSGVVGAENSAENVSRTSAPAFGNASGAQPVAEADTVEDAISRDAVVGAVAGAADDTAVHGDVDQGGAGFAPAGLVQFDGAEVGQTDLEPARAADAGDGLDAEAVAVADVDHRAGEGLTSPRLGRHAAAIRDAGAGVGEGRAGDQGDAKGGENDSDHGVSIAQTGAAA